MVKKREKFNDPTGFNLLLEWHFCTCVKNLPVNTKSQARVCLVANKTQSFINQIETLIQSHKNSLDYVAL